MCESLKGHTGHTPVTLSPPHYLYLSLSSLQHEQQCEIFCWCSTHLLSLSELQKRSSFPLDSHAGLSVLLLLTSGRMEMLLFSRLSSSSSRHLARERGMADSLLYLRPSLLMLARLPGRGTERNKCEGSQSPGPSGHGFSRQAPRLRGCD